MVQKKFKKSVPGEKKVLYLHTQTHKDKVKQLNQFGFGKQYNPRTIQHDSSNCGLYSVLSNLMAIIQLNDLNIQNETDKVYGSNSNAILNITEIVDDIGNDAKKINKKGIYKLKERLIGWSL